jgi:hypothetical protein
LIIEDGERTFWVDTDTGEIEAEQVNFVTTNKKRKKEDKYYSDSLLSTTTARSKDDIEAFIKATIDKRKLITLNNARLYHDVNCGEVMRNGTKNNFTVPAYNIMEKLINALTLNNCIICTPEDLGVILDCDPKHNKRTLESCKSLVRYQGTRDMQRGFVKLFINPAFGWKGDCSIAYRNQQRATGDWYSGLNTDLKEFDVGASGDMKFSPTLDKWLLELTSRAKPFSEDADLFRASFFSIKGMI